MRDFIGGVLLMLAAKILPPETLRLVLAKVKMPERVIEQTTLWRIVCPDCGAEVPVGALPLRLEDQDGVQVAVTEPDLSDVWAHAWTHDEKRTT